MSTHPTIRRPPFCPNPKCDSRKNPTAWRYAKKGFYLRDRAPKRVQRYQCSHCLRYFSSQTFAVTYWLKRGDLLESTFHRLVSCSGMRQIARETGVSHSTIRRLSDRLGRHCLLFHEAMKPKDCPNEPIVLDGFRTFEHSQYWPMDLNWVVGTSLFVYGFNDAELRRSGTMRPAQAVKRTILEKRYGRPAPRATERQVHELLERVIPKGGTVTLRSDEHPAYPRAVAKLKDRVIHHERTSSKEARTTRNPLFPVNLADMLLRHCSSNHKRETIAFSKRRQSILYRAAIWTVWRNYMKDRSENRKLGPPAKLLGLIPCALSVRQVLERRLFPDDFQIKAWLRSCYFGRISTRAISHCEVHGPRFAI